MKFPLYCLFFISTLTIAAPKKEIELEMAPNWSPGDYGSISLAVEKNQVKGIFYLESLENNTSCSIVFEGSITGKESNISIMDLKNGNKSSSRLSIKTTNKNNYLTIDNIDSHTCKWVNPIFFTNQKQETYTSWKDIRFTTSTKNPLYKSPGKKVDGDKYLLKNSMVFVYDTEGAFTRILYRIRKDTVNTINAWIKTSDLK